MNDFYFKKSLGQNFLHNHRISNKIVNLAKISPESSVVEIGCGNGALTEQILDQNPANLTVIELDERCILMTKDRLAGHANFPRLHFINQDALNLKIADLGLNKPIIISNLPYSVGSRILVNLLSEANCVERMILMFQKEVAMRLVARKNSKEYGILSVISQVIGDVKINFDVSPRDFTPAPKVISSVVEILPKTPINKEDFDILMSILRQLFGQRRKMIRSYCGNFPLEILGKYGEMRAENLSCDDILHILAKVKTQ